MASESDEFDKNIENLRSVVRKSFARIYASLKARELKTLRQLDVIHKQCQNNRELKNNCVKNIEISYNNETTLLNNINNYGVINYEKLNFDNDIFTLEDYVSPYDDHMYLYKTIEDVTKGENIEDVEAIEEAALKEITATDDCVCIVDIQTKDISRKFRNLETNLIKLKEVTNTIDVNEAKEDEYNEIKEDEKSEASDAEVKKINPTDDWLNSIKNQTETEPTQVTDVMEHSTITCS